jgi:hypothetical protein
MLRTNSLATAPRTSGDPMTRDGLKATPRRHHCFNCGEDLGEWDRFCDQNDTCGSAECNREAQWQAQAERDEAHEQLDRDLGWGGW